MGRSIGVGSEIFFSFFFSSFSYLHGKGGEMK